MVEKVSKMGRYYCSGAYRDDNKDKPNYSGFLSPLVIKAFGEYMLKHQLQSDGNLRGADNWKQGMDKHEYLESAWRHLMDVWLEDEGYESRDGLKEALGGLLFNVMGYWYELLMEERRGNKKDDQLREFVDGLRDYGILR